MADNVKMEILYYGADADADLEFGTLGSFSPRILTDRVHSDAELLAALKKATMRNELILVVGGFDTPGFTELIARAVGKRAVLPKDPDAVPGQDRPLPEGSIPLLSEDGALCGAVMESHYQSILLLSGDKSRRDAVLRPLVIPYISDRFAEILRLRGTDPASDGPRQTLPEQARAESTPSDTVETEPEPSEQTEIEPIPPDTTESAPESEQPEPGEPESARSEPTGDEQATPDPEQPEQGQPEPAEREAEPSGDVDFPSAGEVLALEPDSEPDPEEVPVLEGEAPILDDPQPPKKSARRKFWIAGIALALVASVAFCIVGAVRTARRPKPTLPTASRLAAMYNRTGLASAKGIDGAVTAWLTMGDLSLPVVYAPGREKKYRTHMPGGAEDPAGTPCISRKADGLEGYYTVRMDGYAGVLARYLNADYVKANRRLSLNSGDYSGTWQIFSVFRDTGLFPSAVSQTVSAAPDGEANEFSDPDAYLKHLQALQNASVVSFQTALTAGDTVAVFHAAGEGGDVVVAACLVARIPLKISDEATSSVSSYPPAIPYMAEDDDVPLNDSRPSGSAFVPLTREEIESNLTLTDSSSASSGSAASAKPAASAAPPAHSASSAASAASAPSVSPDETVVTVLSNGVNVRAAAGVKAKQLGVVHLGQSFPYVSEKEVDGSLWYAFRFKADTVGWISQNYSMKSSAADAPTTQNISTGNVTLTVSNNGNVRQGSALDIISGIVEAEMSSGGSMEALKAQAVAAYSFLLVRGSARGIPVSVAMKTPGERSRQAARAVLGQCAYYNDQVAQTYYYAMSAGVTANCEDIWMGVLPYLKSVPSQYDMQEPSFATLKPFTSAELRAALETAYPGKVSFPENKAEWIACSYDANNTYCKWARAANTTVKGSDLAAKLGLRSPAFTVTYDAESDVFTFHVRGYGHGVGMSQVGANGYARSGWSYKQILEHYYPGVTIR